MTIDSDIERLKVQEQRLRFKQFDEAVAWKIGCDLKAEAERQGLAVAIDVRMTQRLLFHFAMAGTAPENFEWVRRKSNTVLRYLKSSYHVGRELAKRGLVMGPERGVDPMDYVSAGGSFPIHVEAAGIIGAITVSGLPQREDHNLVVAVLAKHLGVPLAEVALGPE